MKFWWWKLKFPASREFILMKFWGWKRKFPASREFILMKFWGWKRKFPASREFILMKSRGCKMKISTSRMLILIELWGWKKKFSTSRKISNICRRKMTNKINNWENWRQKINFGRGKYQRRWNKYKILSLIAQFRSCLVRKNLIRQSSINKFESKFIL